MTWIRAFPIEEADERLRELMERQRALYPVEYALQVSPSGDSVVTAHTLMPDALYHIFAAFGEMMSPNLPLSRAQHEMIATAVSVENRCVH
jgi:hypothetical protein